MLATNTNVGNLGHFNMSQGVTMSQGYSGSTQREMVTPSRVDETIYITDLPLATTVLDVSECFERAIGPCEAVIKR